MPYRVSAKPREPQSPDVDVNLLRKHWSARALIFSLVYSPLFAWWVVTVQGGNGPRQVTLNTKIGLAVAFVLWLLVLSIVRARHERVVKQAMARMEREAEAFSRVRIDEEPSRAREGDDVALADEQEGDPLEPRARSIHDK